MSAAPAVAARPVVSASPSLPVGLSALRLMVATCYFIYIPVSLFRSEFFLFLLDGLLAVAVLMALTSRAFTTYAARHGMVLAAMAAYTGCTVFAWLVLSDAATMDSLKTLRNLLYCVGIFVVALTYITDRRRLEALLHLMMVLTLFAALYGFRQAIFGYWDFEIERLSKMGSSLGEIILLGRLRLTSTFGDPLLCGFYMMAGLFTLRARSQIGTGGDWRAASYAFAALASFAVLVASLTRAPLLGLFVGAGTAFLFESSLTIRSLRRFLAVTLAAAAFIFVVLWAYDSGALANSTNAALRFLDTALGSVWSLLNLFAGAQDADSYVLVGQSRDARLRAWGEGLSYLAREPLGAGFTHTGTFSFAIGDTGVLQVALLIGVPGALAFASLMLLPLVKGMRALRATVDRRDRRCLAAILGFWVAFGVTTGISSLATSSAVSIVAWLFAAVLINARIIFGAPAAPVGGAA